MVKIKIEITTRHKTKHGNKTTNYKQVKTTSKVGLEWDLLWTIGSFLYSSSFKLSLQGSTTTQILTHTYTHAR